MQAFWVVTLALPEHTFWDTTPKVFEAYSSAHKRNEDRADYRAGVVASTIVNVNRGNKRGRPVQPQDFFGGRKSVAPDALAQKAAMIFAAAAPSNRKEERHGERR